MVSPADFQPLPIAKTSVFHRQPKFYKWKNDLLRWLTRVFLRLDSARYHRLPNVSINRAFTNDASSPKKKGNHHGAWKALNHFGISRNSFKIHSNMCLSLGPKKGWQKTLKITGKRALIYSCFLACNTWRHMSGRPNENPRVIPRVFFWFLWRHDRK